MISQGKLFFFESERKSIFDEVEPLSPVEWKPRITGKKCQILRNGMSNDDMVARVAMVLYLIDFQS